MNYTDTLYRANLLLEQKRYDNAKGEAENVLSADPTNVEALQILAHCYLGMGQIEKANDVIEGAIRQDPTDYYSLYLKGLILCELSQYSKALQYTDNAIAVNPMFAEAYGVKATALYALARFEEALEAANQGLSVQADNNFCLNLRAKSLLKLGRTEENRETTQQALKNNPEDTYTHTNAGYTCLELGDSDGAKKHFKEALRIAPNNESARYGMIQALKADNIFYNLWLKYAFWMESISPRARWAFIIVGYLLIQFIDSVKSSLGPFETVATIFVIAYVVFAISTWIIEPVSNLFLRFHSFGKYVLSDQEKKYSNYTFGFMLMALLGLLITLIAAREPQWYNIGFYIACYSISLVVVVSAVAATTTEKGFRNLRAAGFIFAGIAVLIIFLGLVAPALALKPFYLSLWGFVGFQFYANAQH